VIDLPGGVALHPIVGQSPAGDVVVQLLQRFAVVGITGHGRVQAEPCMSAHSLKPGAADPGA